MANEPKVQIASEPGTAEQFGKSHLAYQHTSKVSAKTAGVSASALLAAIGVAVIAGTPSKERSDKTSYFLGIAVPQDRSNGESLKVPTAESQASGRTGYGGRGGRSRAIIHLQGPQIIVRPRNIPIPPGAMVKAVLVSGASNGPVKAELKEPLIVAGETLLEAGTVLTGTGTSGEERLMIRFRQAVFQDGTAIGVSAQATDAEDKIAGIKGSNIGGKALKLAAGIGLNFVGGLSQGLQDTQGQSGAVIAPSTIKNALMNGAARASIQESQDLMNEYRNEKPVIEIGAGTLIYVLFEDSSTS